MKPNTRTNQKNNRNRPKRPQGGQSSNVEIFTASFCPHCREAKVYFKARGIRFKEHNLERSKEAEKRFRGYGGKAIPLILVNGKVLRRWDAKAFEAAYGA